MTPYLSPSFSWPPLDKPLFSVQDPFPGSFISALWAQQWRRTLTFCSAAVRLLGSIAACLLDNRLNFSSSWFCSHRVSVKEVGQRSRKSIQSQWYSGRSQEKKLNRSPATDQLGGSYCHWSLLWWHQHLLKNFFEVNEILKIQMSQKCLCSRSSACNLAFIVQQNYRGLVSVYMHHCITQIKSLTLYVICNK